MTHSRVPTPSLDHDAPVTRLDASAGCDATPPEPVGSDAGFDAPAEPSGAPVGDLSDVELVASIVDPALSPPALDAACRLVGRGRGLAAWGEDPLTVDFGAAPDPRAAHRLRAACELARRLRVDVEARASFTTPELVFAHVRDLVNEPREHVVAILLDARHRYLRRETISIGSVDASIVHPREVFRRAVAVSASAIIVAHNHPSGDPTPSRDDVAITRRLVRAGELLGVRVLDHVIVSRSGFRSLERDGLMT